MMLTTFNLFRSKKLPHHPLPEWPHRQEEKKSKRRDALALSPITFCSIVTFIYNQEILYSYLNLMHYIGLEEQSDKLSCENDRHKPTLVILVSNA